MYNLPDMDIRSDKYYVVYVSPLTVYFNTVDTAEFGIPHPGRYGCF